MHQGQVLLAHTTDGWELAPKFIRTWIGDRKNIFNRFALFDDGIELYYNSKNKTPIFLKYPEIECVYIITGGDYQPDQITDRHLPTVLVIDSATRRFKTFPSYHFPVVQIRGIFEEKNCKIGKKIINNLGTFDYPIEHLLFREDGFEIVFVDGRHEKYLWENVEKISPLWDPPFKIKFFDGKELSLDLSDIAFTTDLLKKYEQYLDCVEKNVFDIK